jgi:hypothetical protein
LRRPPAGTVKFEKISLPKYFWFFLL